MTSVSNVQWTLGGLCEGYGGLTMAVQQLLHAELAWYAEIDKDAAQILAHHHPGVPNHGDLTSLAWADHPVDILGAGFPCQPVSGAGKRQGVNDERWLFDDIVAGLGRMDPQPRLCVFENVLGLLSANGGDAMARVVHGLASVGYVGRWRTVRASDAGAPHNRRRVFIVAVPVEDADSAARGEWRLAAPGQAEGRGSRADAGGRGGAPAADPSGERHGCREDCGCLGCLDGSYAGVARERERSREVSGDRSPTNAADAAGDGWDEGRPEPARLIGGPDAAERGDSDAPYADLAGLEGREPAGGHELLAWGDYEPAVRRWEALTRPAPAPTEAGKTGQRLSPRFVEWMMGLPAGHVTDVPISRNAQLKALGNGVVPQQAALALSMLGVG